MFYQHLYLAASMQGGLSHEQNVRPSVRPSLDRSCVLLRINRYVCILEDDVLVWYNTDIEGTVLMTKDWKKFAISPIRSCPC